MRLTRYQRIGLSAPAFRHGDGEESRSPSSDNKQYRAVDFRVPYAIQLEHANV
jgi:hypothetical protein